MITLTNERVLPLSQACRHLPRRRGIKPTHPATLYRWAKGGIKGVRLETIKVGGSMCTSIEALQRFCERLSAAGQQEVGRGERATEAHSAEGR